MSSRPRTLGCRLAVVTVALAWPLCAPAAPSACADSPPVAFELSVGSGMMTRDGKESRIEIQAHEDGCVRVHRPWFLRDAGEYELRLSAQEWVALQNAVAPAELAKVDQQRLNVQSRTVWKDPSNTAVVFAEPDADVFTLQWRDGDKTHQLVARNPQQASARQTNVADVSRVGTAVGALRALAARPGKLIAAEIAP